MIKLKGYLLLGLAAIFCPCHLPLLLLLLGGTAIGALLSESFALAFVVAAVVFTGALLAGLRVLEQTSRTARAEAQIEPAPLRHGLGEALRERAVATSPVEDAHA